MLLSQHIAALPRAIQLYHLSSGKFVIWANELLEELSGRKILPEVRKEYGAVINNQVWINKPSNLIKLHEVYSPLNYLQKYRVIDTNGKFKLIDEYFEDDDGIDLDTFSDSTVTSITAALTGRSEDDLKNYLMVITSGSNSGKTYVLSGNDESDTTTVLYYLHSLTSALSENDIVTAKLVHPNYYVMIDCTVAYEPISANSDEIPIDDKFERRVVPAWLRWKAEQDTNATSKETVYWGGEVERILGNVSAEASAMPNKAKGRRLVGFIGR